MRRPPKVLIVLVALVVLLATVGLLMGILTPWEARPLFWTGPVLGDMAPIRRWIPVPPNTDSTGVTTWFEEQLNVLVVVGKSSTRVAHDPDGSVSVVMESGTEFGPGRASFVTDSGPVEVTAADSDLLIVSIRGPVARLKIPANYVRTVRQRLNQAGADGAIDALLVDQFWSPEDRVLLEQLRGVPTTGRSTK